MNSDTLLRFTATATILACCATIVVACAAAAALCVRTVFGV
jgi:hypothetical protein